MNQTATALTRIEQYLSQRQALTGNIVYTIPNVEAFDTVSLDTERDTTLHPKNLLHNTDVSTNDASSDNSPITEISSSDADNADKHEQLLASTTTISMQIMANTLSMHDDNDDDSALPLFGTSAPIVTPAIKKKNVSSVNTAWQSANNLDVLYDHIHTCQNCKLGATRTKFVFGTGNPNAGLMVIGEAPGADEDAQGEPFVGRGGQLLTKILEAIHFKREDVFIANIIKCRPPENRRPEAEEVAECEPYLYKQIELVQPKLILALGLTAVNTLLKSKHTMGAIRGKVMEFRGIPMMTTYHPAALLRNPEWKRAAWEDIQLLRKLYDETLPGK